MRLLHVRGGDAKNLGPYRIETLIPREDVAAASVYRVRIDAGTATATSYHLVAEELYLVLAGDGVVVLDGVEYELRAGDLLRLPPGTRHAFRAGDAGLEMLDVHAPGCFPDHDTYFEGERPAGFGSERGA